MRTCGSKFWEELHLLASREISVEVEHVKAHCTKKDKKEISQFEKFVAEGNEEAEELATTGAMRDEGFMAEATPKTVQQEKERRSVRTLAVRCQLRVGKIVKSSSRSEKENGFSWTRKGEKTKHRTEWCADANKYRCMRCKQKQQVHENARKMHRTKVPVKLLGKSGKQHLGGRDAVRRMNRQGEVLIWWSMHCCNPDQVGTKEYDKMPKRIQILEDGRVPVKEARNLKIEGQTRRIT